MTFSPSQVQLSATAAVLWGGRAPGSSILIYNPDAVNTIYLSGVSGIQAGGSNTMPLGPGQSVTLDGSESIYAVAPAGTAAAVVAPGGSSFFQPTSLSSLGGVSVFIQPTAPVQPPAIPTGSIWLQTTISSGTVIGFWTWSGSTWVAQEFNASEVIAAGTIVASLIAAGTIVAGIVNGTTITGATIIADGASGEFLVYSGTPVLGNLVASVSPVAGTDTPGNPYKAGVTVYGTGGNTSYVQATAGSPAAVNIGTGDTAQQAPGTLTSGTVGSGPTRQLGSELFAPAVTGQAAGSYALVSANSGSVDLTTSPPTATMAATDGTSIAAVNVQPTLITLAGTTEAADAFTFSDTATLTGITTPSAPASGASLWSPVGGASLGVVTHSGLSAQVPLTQSDTGTSTLGNSTTAVALTRTWTLEADAVVSGTLGTIWEIETTLNGTIEAASQLQLGIMLDGTFIDLAPITPGFTAGDNFTGTVRVKILVTATGATGSCDQVIDGTIQDGTATRTPSTSMVANGIRTGQALNTTTTHTLAVGAKWNAAVTGQTVSGIGSKYTRYGL